MPGRSVTTGTPAVEDDTGHELDGEGEQLCGLRGCTTRRGGRKPSEVTDARGVGDLLPLSDAGQGDPRAVDEHRSDTVSLSQVRGMERTAGRRGSQMSYWNVPMKAKTPARIESRQGLYSKRCREDQSGAESGQAMAID